MIIPARPLAEVTQHAIQVLSKEIGVADTMRFLNQFANGSGNYTDERQELVQALTLDEILSDIRNSSR